ACILRIGFHTQAGVQPGQQDTIHFEFAEFNEGGPMATNDFYKTINRPPVVTWFGMDAPDTIDALVIQESHTYEFLIDAHDYDIDCNHPCGDSIYLWAQSDPITDDCPWIELAVFDSVYGPPAPPYIVGPVRGCGYVEALFEWHPPKHGICDDFWVDFIAMSTFETGQPLYDTLTVHFIVEDCMYQFAWCEPPPEWTDPWANPPFDTLDVFACQRVEIPVGFHFDYSYGLTEPIWSMQVAVDYDNRLKVFEVGNEGLITENIGAMTYNIVPDYSETEGKIYVTLAFNHPLQWPPWPMPPDPLPYGFLVSEWYKVFYVGFEIPEDLEACNTLILTIQQEDCKVNEGLYGTCAIEESYLHVEEFESAGWVYYSDIFLGVPGVSIFQGDACYEGALADVTDGSGAYGVQPYPGCASFCIWPEMENTLTVQDQIVTSFDATMILRLLCGAITLSHNDSLAADVTGDGTIGAFDASVILKWVVTGYVGNDLIPSHFIGDWIFEYYGDLLAYWGAPCVCYTNLQQNYVDEDWEAVIIGDVSQNWPGPPKAVVSDLEARMVGKTLTMDLSEVSAVDMVIASEAELKVADVTANGLVEWAADGRTIRLAGASETNLGEVTVTFERLVYGELGITARADEGAIMTSTVKVVPLPTEYSLSQNYPNPFNPLTSIEYALPEAAKVRVEVYNVLGQVVDVLVDGNQEAGFQKVVWDASDMASGIYFYRIRANDFKSTKRMVLLK
ncbi:MAG: T9SS type A sorting domain-containing protein, partial [Gemmatimonadota bacterium]